MVVCKPIIRSTWFMVLLRLHRLLHLELLLLLILPLLRAQAAAPTLAANPAEGGGLGSAGLGASLSPGLGGLGGTGASGVLGAGLPDFEQMQQQLTQNPNMMREIINMPSIQSLMNNPDLMRNLIMSNPQMCDIIDHNPELAHILNDPKKRAGKVGMQGKRKQMLIQNVLRNNSSIS